MLFRSCKIPNGNDLLLPEEESYAYIDMAKLYDGDVHEHIKFTPDGKIISTLSISLFEEESRIYHSVFKDIHYAFPCPFKKGDILFDIRYREYPNHNLMVFEKMVFAENGAHCTYGYVMDDGYIMRDGFDCLNLEYYKSDQFGEEYRALDYVRKYLLGELSLTGLMNKHHQILCETQAKNTAFYSDL